MNITGPSLVLSQVLRLWDAHVITPSFKFPAFRSHSVTVTELHWGIRLWVSDNTHRFNHNVNTSAQLKRHQTGVVDFLLVDHILDISCRPHKLLFMFNDADNRTGISQPLTKDNFLCFPKSRCWVKICYVLHELVYEKKADATTNVSEYTKCCDLKPSRSVCRYINPS